MSYALKEKMIGGYQIFPELNPNKFRADLMVRFDFCQVIEESNP